MKVLMIEFEDIHAFFFKIRCEKKVSIKTIFRDMLLQSKRCQTNFFVKLYLNLELL